MSIAESLLPEFDRETGLTRQLLERVPNEKASWKPHPKSFSLGDLSLHIANLLTWAVSTMKETEFDINPPGGPGFVPLKFESIGSTQKTLDENVRTTRAVIAGATDGELMVMWTFKNGGKTVFSMPRIAVLRSFVMNHMIHHRGQLTVYLRELDVPLPQIYGPTADSPM